MTPRQRSPLDAAAARAAAERLHREAIIFDMTAPLFDQPFPRGLDDYLAGGVTAIGSAVTAIGSAVTAPGSDDWFSARASFLGIAALYQRIRHLPDKLMLIESVADFARAKASGRLGIVLAYQSCSPFEQELGHIELFYRLGLRAALLSYNRRNLVADGCTERHDGGLSAFGVEVIREMNRVGMVVDGSHVGVRSSLEAIAVCDAPFIFSHSGCKAIYDHPRNLTDEQIRACAASGGVVGVFVLPFFLAGAKEPAVADLVRHIGHIANLVGVAHVGIGMDYFPGLAAYRAPDAAEWSASERVELERFWNPGEVPERPSQCAPGLETPAGMRNLTAALFAHGFAEAEVRQIMGENFLRVFRQVWK